MITSARADPSRKAQRPEDNLGRIGLGLIVMASCAGSLLDRAAVRNASAKNNRWWPVVVVVLAYCGSRGGQSPQ